VSTARETTWARRHRFRNLERTIRQTTTHFFGLGTACLKQKNLKTHLLHFRALPDCVRETSTRIFGGLFASHGCCVGKKRYQILKKRSKRNRAILMQDFSFSQATPLPAK